MTDRHPYVASGGIIVQVVKQLRESFPTTVTSDTLKKLGLAPKNESFVINTLRFLNAIDEEGNRTDTALDVFYQHEDSEFQKQFAEMVKVAYSDLFELHQERTWELDKNQLVTFFRRSDSTSALVGQRQAATFKALAGLCGYGELPQQRSARAGGGAVDTNRSKKKSAVSSKKKTRNQSTENSQQSNRDMNAQSSEAIANGVALTVRLEINLPADGDQETYDRIFRSIRENLLND